MTVQQAKEKIAAASQRLYLLGGVSSLMGWDQAVSMPVGALKSRSLARAELEMIVQEALLDSELRAAISDLEQTDLLTPDRRNLDLLKKRIIHSSCLPKDFIREKSLANLNCEYQWRQFRKENNWKDYRPLLEKNVQLARTEMQLREQATGLQGYDAILDQYFDGVTVKFLENTLNSLGHFVRDNLSLAEKKSASSHPESQAAFYPIEKQKKLALFVMEQLGFDLERGRLDESTHPFCTSPPGEARITTRFSENDYLIGFSGVIHETGHALYEQNLPEPLYAFISQDCFPIHEGQSLFYEMQVATSKAFAEFIVPHIRKFLENPNITVQNYLQKLNQVKPSLIRVEADEFTYPLHIQLRFELEQELLSNRLKVEEIPDAWNEKMKSYLGLSTEGNFKDGCMQDIHWNIGMFGYFPAYTLGALSAAQLAAAQKRDRPEFWDEIQNGNFANIKSWLSSKVWSQGRLHDFQGLMLHATGEPLNVRYFTDYLTQKLVT